VPGPNDLASITLKRVVGVDGCPRLTVTTWVSGAAGDPMRAVQCLKHGVTLTLEQVIRGEIPLPGNGEYLALDLPEERG